MTKDIGQLDSCMPRLL